MIKRKMQSVKQTRIGEVVFLFGRYHLFISGDFLLLNTRRVYQLHVSLFLTVKRIYRIFTGNTASKTLRQLGMVFSFCNSYIYLFLF